MKPFLKALLQRGHHVGRDWPWQIAGALTVVLVVRPLLWAFDANIPIYAEFPLDIALVFVGFILGTVLVIYRLGYLLSTLRSIDTIARHPARKEIRAFIHDDLRSLQDTLTRVRSEEGAEMGRAAVQAWTQRCFELGEGAYEGVDSHVPSSFMEANPEYLSYHARNLERNPRGRRVLIVTIPALQADSRRNKRTYDDFVDWHRSNLVELLHAAPVRARELAESFGVPVTDVAIWRDKYALLFEPVVGSQSIRLRMVFKGEALFESCSRYFEALASEAMPFTEIPPVLGRNLARAWEDFVDPPRRLALQGPFLLKLLEPYKKKLVLDAAAGVGAESSFLLDNGFDVTANEIDDTLADVARLTARRNGFNLDMVKTLWQDLADVYNHRPRFDVILVLGNSLCLVLDPAEQEQCMRSFYTALKPGGMLVVDERNFSFITENKQEIDRNPVKFKDDWGGVLFRGKAVRCCPTVIDSISPVVFTYYKDNGTVKDRQDVERNRIGTLEMYPFKEGELASLIERVGFKDVSQWSDFTKGHAKHADFYTYVGCKPPAN